MEAAAGPGIEVATGIFTKQLAALQHASHLRVRLLL